MPPKEAKQDPLLRLNKAPYPVCVTNKVPGPEKARSCGIGQCRVSGLRVSGLQGLEFG
jgi:hypothetical protein